MGEERISAQKSDMSLVDKNVTCVFDWKGLVHYEFVLHVTEQGVIHGIFKTFKGCIPEEA